MSPKDLVLNIAVNMGRVSRWVMEGKQSRVDQFLNETEKYLADLEKSNYNPKFDNTLKNFKQTLTNLKKKKKDHLWAEDALTWANILQHRAKLA